jgi:hypothetical protein
MVDPPVSNQTPIHPSPPSLPRCRRPAPGPPAPAWANAPRLPGRSRKGGPARSGGPPFLPEPRREAKETPEGGAAACCAQGRNTWNETNGGKQMEGNTWRKQGPVSGGLLVLPPQAVPARTLHERGLAGRFLTGAPVVIPSRAADICSAQAPGFRRPPKVPLRRVGGRRPGPLGLVGQRHPAASRRRFEPCVRFSRTRLSDIVHRLAYAVVGFTVPPRRCTPSLVIHS